MIMEAPMSTLYLFMMVSLDGFFEGPGHDLSWHHVDDEFNVFAAKQLAENGTILFGRRTYELMEDFWPNYKPEDKENERVRDLMDTLPKIVYSTSLTKVQETKDWKNVTLRHEVDAEEIKRLKADGEKPIAVLGSSNLCVTLLKLGLLDELRIMVNPVVIGKGTRLFEGLDTKLDLTLVNTRTFGNGNELLTYTV